MVTPLQHKVYEYIQTFINHHGFSPSLTEVAKGIGISPKSISLISRSIHALAKAGRLSFNSGYRNTQIVEKSSSLKITAHLSSQIENLIEHQHLDLMPLLKNEACFLLKVKGNNMQDENIVDGDLVICKSPQLVKEGDQVIATIDHNAAILRRISFQIQDRITLIPNNTIIKPKAYLPHRVHIQGVFLGVLRIPNWEHKHV